MTLIEIVVEGKGEALMEIDDRNPRTAREICDRLPREAGAQVWQEEVYFGLPFSLADENPRRTRRRATSPTGLWDQPSASFTVGPSVANKFVYPTIPLRECGIPTSISSRLS